VQARKEASKERNLCRNKEPEDEQRRATMEERRTAVKERRVALEEKRLPWKKINDSWSMRKNIFFHEYIQHG
jgi:hypothetical protein